MFLKNPVNLFLFAPDDVPIIIPSLLPLAVVKAIVYTVFESSFELDIGARSAIIYGGFG
jgi:hypothetical protein